MCTTAVKLDMTVQCQTVFLIDKDAVKITLTIDFFSRELNYSGTISSRQL